TRRRSNPRRAGRLFRRRPSRPVPGWFQTRADLLTEHRTVIRRRTMVMTGVVCVALSVLALRLAQVQVIQGGRLQHLAQRQQMEVIAIEPHRGLILDRRGRPLAINVEATSIYAVPSAIADRQAFAARVAPLLRQRVDEVRRRLATGRHFAWLARKVSPQMVARVRALGMADQIGFLTEDKRAYPNGPLAAQVIGFAGIDNQGLTGVELSYEHVLHGTIGRAIVARDGLGRVMVETQQVLGTPQDRSEEERRVGKEGRDRWTEGGKDKRGRVCGGGRCAKWRE